MILPIFRTSLAIAGPDFCIVAADTRQSEGYLINTRYAPKAYKLYIFPFCLNIILFIYRTNTAVLATSGYHADGQKMAKDLLSNIRV